MSETEASRHDGPSERWVESIYRRWVVWSVLLLGVTLLSGWLALRVGVDNSVEIWFLEDDPALQSYREFQETFGNDEVVAIGVSRADGGDMLDAEGLRILQAVDDKSEAVEGIAHVDGVVDTPTVSGDFMEIRVGPIVGEGGITEDSHEGMASAILADPQLQELVSEDRRMSTVVAQMEAMDDIDAQRDGVLVNLRAALDEIPGAEVALGGIGVIYAALNEASTVGALGFIAGSYGLITVLLLLLFGRVGPVALTLGTVGLGATWLMGFYGLFDRDINMVTMVMPTLVLVIGVSDCVHMLSHVAEQDPALPRLERVKRGVGFVFWPCLFNTLTTAVGFLALTSSSMPVVRDLGSFCAAGLLVAFVLSLVLCSLLGGRPAFQPRINTGGLVQRLVDGMASLAVNRSGMVIAGAAILSLVAALGVTRIETDTYSIDYLAEDHPVRVDSDRIEASSGPYTPLEFVVHHPDGVLNIEVMGAIADWQDRMEAEVDVGWSRSAVDIFRQLNQVMAGGDEAQYVVPPNDAALEQLLLLYESDSDNDLADFISEDATEARVTVGVPMGSAKTFGEQIDRLETMLALPPDTSLEAGGYLPLYVQMMDYIVKSQLTSFGLAFVAVFGLVGLLFRSVRMSVLALPANLLPVLMTLGLMGVLGIRLDVATVTISAIVLGLVVDDTTQFLYRFRHESKQHETVTDAVSATVRGVGRPMAITTVVLGLGFLVLGFAAIKSVAWFGILLATALFSALFSDLLVIPALLVALDRGPQN